VVLHRVACPGRSAEQYACPGDDLLTKARAGKRYLSNARRTYGRARLSASEHDGKSYIRRCPKFRDVRHAPPTSKRNSRFSRDVNSPESCGDVWELAQIDAAFASPDGASKRQLVLATAFPQLRVQVLHIARPAGSTSEVNSRE
jgi:hypothetical protein